MKKYLLTILAIFLLLSSLSFSSCGLFVKDTEEEEHEYVPPVYPASEGLEFALSTDETYYTWTGRGTCEDTRIVVPAEYNGKPVKAVSYIFLRWEGDLQLEELILPEGIEIISDKSFSGCYNLRSVTIPKSLVKIGKEVFWNCPIQTIYINNLKSWLNLEGYIRGSWGAIDYYVEGKLLTDLEIPKGIKTIRNNAFINGQSIKTVTIPNGVESIGVYAFSRCENLVSLQLPNTLKTIEGSAFDRCKSLETLNIPDSVTSIGDYAFTENISLRRVTIGKNVESIGDSAFGYCFALLEICNKSSLTLEKGSSNNGAVALYAKKITTNSYDTNIEFIDDYVFYVDGNNSSLLYYRGDDTNLVLPNIGYKYEINAFAFAESEIESVVIPDFVTAMGNRAFYQCLNLKSVEIQANIPAIKKYTFFKCESLESVNLPSSLTSIGDYAFYYCSMLQNVEMPNGVTTIGNNAFGNCDMLKDINIPNGVTTIGEYAFCGCRSFTSITVPSSVTSLGKCAFSGCINMRNATILGSITTIGECTFSDCRSLISVTLPNSLTRIETYAFADCSSLFTITIPTNVNRIEDSAFNGCYSLIEICNKSKTGVSEYERHVIKNEYQSNLKYVGDYVFYDDGNQVYFIKYIGDNKELVLPEYEGGKEYKIYKHAFRYNDDITSVVFPNSVTHIEHEVFYDCDALESVVIPDSVVSIDGWTFYDCDALKNIFIPSSVVEMGYAVFECSNSVTIYCEADSKPEGWSDSWNKSTDRNTGVKLELPVVWGYTQE